MGPLIGKEVLGADKTSELDAEARGGGEGGCAPAPAMKAGDEDGGLAGKGEMKGCTEPEKELRHRGAEPVPSGALPVHGKAGAI